MYKPEEFIEESLVRLAKRDNNLKRSYLYVNPFQGKHIPADPDHIFLMCKALADRLNDKYGGEKLFVIGFAETATGIAAVISTFLNNVLYYQNTTRESLENSEYINFLELHSHAPDQRLYSNGIEEALAAADRVLIIDDEISTGKTIEHLIKALREKYNVADSRFGIASIINSMNDDRLELFNNSGIDVSFFKKIPYEYRKDCIEETEFNAARHLHLEINGDVHFKELQFSSKMNPRKTVHFDDYVSDVKKASEVICSGLRNRYGKILILGTEEFMFPAIYAGKAVKDRGLAEQVMVHATTRSPIIASEDSRYPLHIRYEIASLYDGARRTFIYNLAGYDKVIIITDAERSGSGINELCSALQYAENTDISVLRWTYEECCR